MIFQGEALGMEADQIARQNVGHRLRIFFLQRDPVAQLHAAGPALRPMRERSAGPRPGERVQRSPRWPRWWCKGGGKLRVSKAQLDDYFHRR